MLDQLALPTQLLAQAAQSIQAGSTEPAAAEAPSIVANLAVQHCIRSRHLRSALRSGHDDQPGDSAAQRRDADRHYARRDHCQLPVLPTTRISR